MNGERERTRIRLVIGCNELETEVASRDVPDLIDRWFLASGAADQGDQARIDALVLRLKNANDALAAAVAAHSPNP